MKNFISVEDVHDINGLVRKAMEFKADPFKNRTQERTKESG